VPGRSWRPKEGKERREMVVMFFMGVGFLLLLGPVVATPAFLALALLLKAKELGVGGVLAGVVAGALVATPVISRGYALEEALGFPFLGALGAATLVVFGAYAVGMMVGYAGRRPWPPRRSEKG
jgi:hypothetical protein